MKKIILLVLIVGVIGLLALSGCKEQDEESSKCSTEKETYNNCIDEAGQEGNIKKQEECEEALTEAGCSP